MPEGITTAQKALILDAVAEAGRVAIMPRFRALEPGEISTKSGPVDLVTIADTEAERLISARVRDGWPGVTVLGEEGVAADKSTRALMGTADPCVVIDPVDGTWNFAKGLATFGVLIAVLRAGQPVWGLLHDPVIGDWIEAEAGEALFVGASGRRTRLAASPEARLSRATGYIMLGLYPKAVQARLVALFPDFLRISTLRCAVHEYRMVAQGHAEFCISGPVPHPWDHAAGVLAVQAAGGVAKFLDGAPYEARRTHGVVLAAGSPALWDRLSQSFRFLLEP